MGDGSTHLVASPSNTAPCLAGSPRVDQLLSVRLWARGWECSLSWHMRKADPETRFCAQDRTMLTRVGPVQKARRGKRVLILDCHPELLQRGCRSVENNPEFSKAKGGREASERIV